MMAMASIMRPMQPTAQEAATPKDQKSAATLSVWHCVLSWFFMNAEDRHWGSESNITAMKAVYEDMNILRSIIHNDNKVDINKLEAIRKVEHSVTKIVKAIPQARWAEEISSMMQEFMAMHKVVTQIKPVTQGAPSMPPPNFMQLVPNCKGRHLACVLTIWYWLAAWSSPHIHDADKKEEFLVLVESSLNADLATLLFTTDSADSKAVPNAVQTLMKKLTEMVNSNPLQWGEVLEHFIVNMKEAGSDRQHAKATIVAAKNTLDMALDHAAGGITTIDPNIVRPVNSRSLGSLLNNSVVKSALPIVSIVDELKEPIGKAIVELPETAKDIAAKAERVADQAAGVANNAIGAAHEIVKDVASAASTIYNDVKGAASTVHDEVVDLVHGIGEGAQKFAHTVSGWFSHLF